MTEPQDSDDDYESLKKKAIELEAAIEAEKKALEQASSDRKKVEKQVKEKEKKQREYPTSRDIKQDIDKVGGEILQQNILKEELKKRRLAIMWIVILILLLSLFFLSEIFWSFFMSKPSVQGNFIIDTCFIRTGSCSLKTFGHTAYFLFNTSDYDMLRATTKKCLNSSIISRNIAMLTNCSFSSISNDMDILVYYSDHETGLIYKEKARAVKTIEVTRVTYAGSKATNKTVSRINAVTGWVESLNIRDNLSQNITQNAIDVLNASN